MYTEAFLRVCKKYVKQYRDRAFHFILDGGKQEFIGNLDNPITIVKITHTEKVFKRIFMEGSVGLGESYCEGNIQVRNEEYKYFLFIFVRISRDRKFLLRLNFLDIFLVMRALLSGKFFTKGSQEADINNHYSLSEWFENENDSNTFYLTWLNKGYVQYSCGKWDRDTKSLEEAEMNKLEFYAKRLGIFKRSPGKTLLDLGCGWGGMMFYMAENYGIRCTGLTLSVAQAAYIRQEIERRKLEDLVNVEVENIHNLEGTYDYIISIGVMEHITDFDSLYRKVAGALKHEGKALIHSMFQTRSRSERDSDAFLTKYIFPGGGIPNLQKNLQTFHKYFAYVDKNELPQKSYPKTIQCWIDNFCAHEKDLRKLLEEKGKVANADFAIRVFKHYLNLVYCGLYEDELVANILVYN